MSLDQRFRPRRSISETESIRRFGAGFCGTLSFIRAIGRVLSSIRSSRLEGQGAWLAAEESRPRDFTWRAREGKGDRGGGLLLARLLADQPGSDRPTVKGRRYLVDDLHQKHLLRPH